MRKGLIYDPEGWLPLERWKTGKEPINDWQFDLTDRGENYQLIFLVGEAVGLTREKIADCCARKGWNPLQVVPFPWISGNTEECEGLIARWNTFFDRTIQQWNMVPGVTAKRLYPSRWVYLIAAEGSEQEADRYTKLIKAQGLDVHPFQREGLLFRHSLDFQVVSPEGSTTAGAVVIVPKMEEVFSPPLPEEVTDTRRVLSLADLEHRMRLCRFRLEQVAFLVPQVTTSLKMWKLVYRLASELVAVHGARVVVLNKETVVAGDEMESDYRDARRSGVLFEKIEPQELSYRPTMDMRQVIIHFTTEKDRFGTELACHWIIPVPDWRIVPFNPSGLLVEDRVLVPLIRPQNVNLERFALPETGMFLFPPWLSPEELGSAIADLRQYLKEGLVAEQGRMEVDEEKCVLCLTCLRTCPWGAVNLEGSTKRRKARVRWELCRVCGLCASSCPAAAISMAGVAEYDRVLVPGPGGENR